MFPYLAIDNPVYIPTAYTVLYGEFGLSDALSGFRANLSNVSLYKLAALHLATSGLMGLGVLGRKGVIPDDTANDFADSRWAYIEFFCKFILANVFSGVSRPNFGNLSSGELAGCRPFASGCATFARAILHVFCIISQKEMFGITARWIVTTMQYIQTIRDGAKMNFPRKAMRKHGRTIRVNAPIPFSIFSPCPNPTGVSFLNMLPKALVDRNRTACTRINFALLAAIFCSTTHQDRRLGKKLITAL